MAVGSDVPAELNPGRLVSVIPYTNCGACASCKRGRFNACQNNQTLGVQRDGALTELLAVPWQKVLAPAGLTLRELALIEPMTVGFHAVDRGGVEKTDTVLVIGCGMIGLGCVAGAARRGARVIAADIDDAKLARAASFGAQCVLNTAGDKWKAALQDLTGGHGPDVVVEAVGSPVTYRLAIEVVAFTGRVVCIGYAKEDVAMTTKYFVQKELDIRGSRNATPADFAEVIAYLQTKPDAAKIAITHTYPFAAADQALKDWVSNPAAVTKIQVELSPL